MHKRKIVPAHVYGHSRIDFMRHAIHILTVSTLDSFQEKMRSAAQTERLQEPAGHVLA